MDSGSVCGSHTRFETSGHAMAARSFGVTIFYFLRSLRFQQAVSAFSFVIGIKVV
jgi:hypothetical protein